MADWNLGSRPCYGIDKALACDRRENRLWSEKMCVWERETVVWIIKTRQSSSATCAVRAQDQRGMQLLRGMISRYTTLSFAFSFEFICSLFVQYRRCGDGWLRSGQREWEYACKGTVVCVRLRVCEIEKYRWSESRTCGWGDSHDGAPGSRNRASPLQHAGSRSNCRGRRRHLEAAWNMQQKKKKKKDAFPHTCANPARPAMENFHPSRKFLLFGFNSPQIDSPRVILRVLLPIFFSWSPRRKGSWAEA
jgi:hypothetical protein